MSEGNLFIIQWNNERMQEKLIVDSVWIYNLNAINYYYLIVVTYLFVVME